MKNLAWLSALSLVVLAPSGCGGGNGDPDTGSTDTGSTDTGGGIDAATPDGGTEEDAGDDGGGALDAGTDACLPVECEAPGPGCRYEGATECDCGTLVCEMTCEPACAEGFFCDLCGGAQNCVEQPEDMGRICPAIYMPICGCDGVTYSNACALGSARMGELRPGECNVPCGEDTCGPFEYCNYDAGCAGDGTCLPRGDADECPDTAAPVCGCDGVTYDNPCLAAAAGATIVTEGPCPVPSVCTPPCGPGESCEPCEGPDGRVSYTCIPVGTAC